MATPQTGVVAVRINGSPMRIRGNVRYSLGGKVREAIEGPTGLAAFSVKGMAAFIEVDTVDGADVDLAALQALSGQTITAQLENGKTIVLNDASVVGLLEANVEDGAITVRFVGPTAKEV